jgi:hypothetical protein
LTCVTVEDYQQQADALLAALRAGDDSAAWRFKWEHPRFKDKTVDAVRDAALDLEDARTVIAAEHSFDGWQQLTHFVHAMETDANVQRFESAVDAVVGGEEDKLRNLLRDDPNLVRARSTRRHHATLLHYIGANGVEGYRQKTPPNAVEIAKMLLDAGAEPDALADLYGAKCTTMSMLVSSAHPAQAGLQARLAELLLDYGAALEGAGTNWQSSVRTALAFGYRDTAEALARRGAPVDLPAAAGLGRTEDVARLLPAADAETRHVALALAAQHGQAGVVRLLLDAGEDPSRYNPEGYHAHSTPLHQAVWADHLDVVRLLVERGASLDVKDQLYEATPLDWAIYGKRDAIADYLRAV